MGEFTLSGVPVSPATKTEIVNALGLDGVAADKAAAEAAAVDATTQAELAAAEAGRAEAAANGIVETAIYTYDAVAPVLDARLFTRPENAIASSVHGISGAVGTEVDAGRSLEFIRSQFYLASNALSFRLFWTKKLLSDGDIDTASPATWTAVGDRIFTSSDIAALGVFVGSPSGVKIPFFDLLFGAAVSREDGHALGWYVLAYDGDNATGNITTLAYITTNATGDPAYVRGFTRASNGVWTARTVGAGIAWEVWGKQAVSLTDAVDVADDARRLTDKAELSFSTSLATLRESAQTTFTPLAGNFRGFTVLASVPRGNKLRTFTVPMTSDVTATQVRLTIHRRQADDPRINVYPFNRNAVEASLRLRELVGAVTLTLAEAGLTAGSGTQVSVSFDLTSLNIWGDDNTKYEFAWDSLNVSNEPVASGFGNSPAISPQNESGWYIGSPNILGTNLRLAYRLEAERYVSSGSAETYAPAARSVLSLGAIEVSGTTITVPEAGSQIVNMRGEIVPFSGSVGVTLPSSGNYRYDVLSLNAVSGALVVRQGTAQAAGTGSNGPGSYAAEVPGLPTGNEIPLAMIALNDAGVVGTVPVFDVVGGFARRSQLTWLEEERAKAREVFYYILKRFAPGQTLNILAIGDSITRVSSSGTADFTAVNGNRDRPDIYLSASPAAAFADPELFDNGSGAGAVNGYFTPWAMMVKRLRDLGMTINYSNLGVNGALSTSLEDTTARATVVAQNPHIVIVAFGMNDQNSVGAVGAAEMRDRLTAFHDHIVVNVANYMGLIIDTPFRAVPITGASFATWSAYQDAVREAAGTINEGRATIRSPGAIVVPWLAGQPENIGIIGRLEQDVCGANQINHPGVGEMFAKTRYLDWLLF